MLKTGAQKPSLKSRLAGGRRVVTLTPEAMIKRSHLPPGEALPVFEPNVEGLDLIRWAQDSRALLESELLRQGAILFRNFHTDTDTFRAFAEAVSPGLIDYYERTVNRSAEGDKIYTASEYPAEHPIPLHNEYSFSHAWPLKLWFYCVRPAARGGESLIADGREVYRLVPAEVRERFARDGVMYVRNFGEGLDLAWEDVFQTSDRREVEDYCRRARIAYEWKGGNRLRTRQVRQAVARHALTGEPVWFNQAHLFHVSSLEREARESLLDFFREEDLPRHAFYGDGSPIEPEALDAVRDAYRRATVSVPWQAGDILLMDNMLVAHGREPFAGPRKILVTMAELFNNPEL